SRPIPDRKKLEREYEATRGARVKSFDSYFDKLLGLLKTWDGKGATPCPADILGFRIVHPFLETLGMTERKLRVIFDFEEVERKGANLSFNAFGYQSIHLLVKLPRELVKAHPKADLPLFEIQLRPILQDAWAEVEHELIYKKDSSPFD
ncbi:MAG: hypothetical protein JXA71_00620, partial [Chitinispirillaceae bacterium]|nr:hypothetical protein [Chitinispirillaceae bacterium]